MEFLAVWLLFAVIPAMIAKNKGRSPALWFVGAVVLSPLIAGLLVLLVPDKKPVTWGDQIGVCTTCGVRVTRRDMEAHNRALHDRPAV